MLIVFIVFMVLALVGLKLAAVFLSFAITLLLCMTVCMVVVLAVGIIFNHGQKMDKY